MKIYAERIRKLRVGRGYSQDQLASMLKVSRSAISMYETGQREPDFETCEAIADIFNVDMDYLIGRSDVEKRASVIPPSYPDTILPMPQMRKIPLIGTIACGEPILAQENIDGEVDLPDHIHADFALHCKGDSMINARIFDGDIVYIRQQDDVDNGQIAAVLIGDEATLKRVYKYPGRLELRPENPTFPVLQYEGDQLAEIRIIGKAVAFTSAVR